jgi:putative membrane protein
MGLLWVLAVIVVIAAILFTKNRGEKGRRKRETGESEALDILRKRYARGEISKEEFEEMKKNLL